MNTFRSPLASPLHLCGCSEASPLDPNRLELVVARGSRQLITNFCGLQDVKLLERQMGAVKLFSLHPGPTGNL